MARPDGWRAPADPWLCPRASDGPVRYRENDATRGNKCRYQVYVARAVVPGAATRTFDGMVRAHHGSYRRGLFEVGAR
jgi:hypothetical protein